MAALLVTTAFGQTGPHVAQARVETLFVSPDGARIVTGTAWDIAEWDAKTGGLIWSNSYAGLGLARVSSSATFSPDGRYLTTYIDNRYGIIDLKVRRGWSLSKGIGGWTYNGKARNDKSGVDIQTGNYLPLTQLEQDVVPLGNGMYYRGINFQGTSKAILWAVTPGVNADPMTWVRPPSTAHRAGPALI